MNSTHDWGCISDYFRLLEGGNSGLEVSSKFLEALMFLDILFWSIIEFLFLDYCFFLYGSLVYEGRWALSEASWAEGAKELES